MAQYWKGDYLTEKETKIHRKKLRLKQRSWANTDSNEWKEWGRNRLQFRDSEKISGVCVTPRVKKIEVNNCQKNDTWSWAAVRYHGNFYDADASDAGGEDGLVYAGLGLWRSNNSDDKKGIFEVWGYVSRCEGYDCDDEPYFVEEYLGTVNGKTNSKPMCVGYDKANHKIVMSIGSKVVDVTRERDLPKFNSRVDADKSWHVLEVRNTVQNCKKGPVTGYVDGEFDDVMVRKYSPEVSCSEEGCYNIGDTGPGGGIVFYVTEGGLHGLEAAPVNQGTAEWGCYGTAINGADGAAVGTGAENTADIIEDCSESGIAARIADEYELNGFDDWFLPSIGELEVLHQTGYDAGELGEWNGVWSSTQRSDFKSQLAQQWRWDLGQVGSPFKSNDTINVVPIRAF